jgi:glutamate synthase (NADPH/NADH) large chain
MILQKFSAKVSGLYRVDGGGDALARRLDEICREVDALIRQGKRFIILSDRDSDGDNAPIPSLLLCSAVHHHLVRERTRTMVGLLIEAGDVREVHHVALLIGFGAAAINPYLALETVENMARQGILGDITPEKAVRNTLKPWARACSRS